MFIVEKMSQNHFKILRLADEQHMQKRTRVSKSVVQTASQPTSWSAASENIHYVYGLVALQRDA